MTPRTLTVTRTVQVKQYEPLSCAIGADLDEGEDLAGAYTELLERMRAFFWEATGHQRIEFAPAAGEVPAAFWQDD